MIIKGSILKGDVNTTLRNNKKAILSTAVWCGDINVIKFLLKNGANPCLNKKEIIAKSKKEEISKLISDSLSKHGCN